MRRLALEGLRVLDAARPVTTLRSPLALLEGRVCPTPARVPCRRRAKLSRDARATRAELKIMDEDKEEKDLGLAFALRSTQHALDAAAPTPALSDVREVMVPATPPWWNQDHALAASQVTVLPELRAPSV